MPGLVPIFSACLTGYLLMRVLRPTDGMSPRWAAALLEAGLGAGLGAGLASSIYFLLTAAGRSSAVSVLLVDGFLLLAFAVLLIWRRGRGSQTEPPTWSPESSSFRYNWVLALSLCGSLGLVLPGMASQATANPHGMWDAWAIWNVRARFLAGPGETWRNAVSPLLDKTHPDYPLLLSGFIARSWKVSGDFDTIVPIVTGLLFFLATLAVLVAGVALLRSASSGLLAGLALMTGYTYLVQPMTQYSDIPLGFYYLSALTLAALAWQAEPEGRKRILLLLAGLSAGLAGWTKNEGLLFLAVFGLCHAGAEWLRSGGKGVLRRVPWLVLGMMPGLLLSLGLKSLLAPVADPVVKEGRRRIAEGAVRGERVVRVLRAMYWYARDFGSSWATHPMVLLLALAAALRVSVPRSARAVVGSGAATLALVFAGYVGVSLGAATPFDRFYAQLFPSFLLVFFQVLRPIEQSLPAAPAPQPAASPSKRVKKKGRR